MMFGRESSTDPPQTHLRTLTDAGRSWQERQVTNFPHPYPQVGRGANPGGGQGGGVWGRHGGGDWRPCGTSLTWSARLLGAYASPPQLRN